MTAAITTELWAGTLQTLCTMRSACRMIASLEGHRSPVMAHLRGYPPLAADQFCGVNHPLRRISSRNQLVKAVRRSFSSS